MSIKTKAHQKFSAMGAYLATIFYVNEEFRYKTKACIHVSGSSVEELYAKCSAVEGYLPTYRKVKSSWKASFCFVGSFRVTNFYNLNRELISPETGRPSIFDIFTAKIWKETFYEKDETGISGVRKYGLCNIRKNATHLLDKYVHVAGFENWTMVFPLQSLVNVRNHAKKQDVNNAFDFGIARHVHKS